MTKKQFVYQDEMPAKDRQTHRPRLWKLMWESCQECVKSVEGTYCVITLRLFSRHVRTSCKKPPLNLPQAQRLILCFFAILVSRILAQTIVTESGRPYPKARHRD